MGQTFKFSAVVLALLAGCTPQPPDTGLQVATLEDKTAPASISGSISGRLQIHNNGNYILDYAT